MYIYEHENWPNFVFDIEKILSLLEKCHIEQGKLLSKIEMLGLSAKNDKILSTITSDVVKSNEIEGNLLNKEQLRSSIARRLGIHSERLVESNRNIDAIAEMAMDATQNFENELTENRLFSWQACLFPTGYSGLYKIDIGKYRSNPMQVVSGAIGHKKIHYEAPKSEEVPDEMEKFLHWANSDETDFFIKAAVSHLWFVTIHPFDDGNGRIARTISDMFLCRSDKTSLRFYSMSNQILKEKNDYYNILEKTQRGNLDITDWIEWFLNCLFKAISESFDDVEKILKKYKYLQSIENVSLNKRQRLMITKLTGSDWFGVLNTSKWAKIAKCSADTALRDITDLIDKGILEKEKTSGGRSTNYKIIGL